MKRFCGKCNTLHEHDHNCTVGKFDRYYRDDEGYTIRNNRRWHKIRDQAKERDHHLCVACRMIDHYYNAYRLEVHHILGVRDYPEQAYDLLNTITLCQHHHREVHAGNLDLAELLKQIPYYAETTTPPTL